MRVTRTSGSVRGGDGDILAYSARDLFERRRRAAFLFRYADAYVPFVEDTN